MAELADAADSKSADLRVLGVRLPLPAPMKSTYGFGLSREAELHCQTLQYLLAQFLSFTEKFLVFDENTVQFE